jgi:4-amino-4-deoxy-L-arabinose transferase-like glycosyltransferase
VTDRRLLAGLAAALIAVATGWLYATRLYDGPIYLAHDEIKFALQAHAIATTGRDVNGIFMPLFFGEAGFSAGRDPVSIYLTALFLKFLPFSESSIRLPSAVVGVLDVVLMFLLAWRIFNRLLLAAVAAVLLALTPAHFIYSRFALDVQYPLPFLMVWLLCLAAYLERRRLRTLFAGMLALGLGAYSYLAFLVMTPVYVLLTAVTLRRERSARAAGGGAARGSGALLPLVVWQVRQPTRYADLVGAYGLYDRDLNPLSGEHGLFGAFSLSARMDVFWNFFNPSFLFFSGDSSVANSTRLVGIFLLPVAILLPFGIYQMLAVRRTPFNTLLLWGFVTAPFAAALLAEIAIRRAMVMLPFAVLIATFGLQFLLSVPATNMRRIAAAALLVLIPFEFARFHADYFGDYRVRSSSWLGGNIRGAVVDIIERAGRGPAGAIYLNTTIPYVDAYWDFYVIKHGRTDLSERTVYYDPRESDLRGAQSGALLLVAAGERPTSGEWTPLGAVREPDGSTSFSVYQR